jgi:2-dehydro-3-deoxyphosphogluconate aldolase / (4S)-4-hydroxy-2-oxoglutarate aldolase
VRDEVIAAVLEARVVAIVRRRTALGDEAVGMVETLVAEGLRVVEITVDTPGALEAIASLSTRLDAVVGAGTVRTSEDVDAVADAGARFIVAPGTDAAVLTRAHARGLATLPGALTPTEIDQASGLGADLVKLFPAGPLGPEYLRALLGPFPGVRFVPTGGIGLDDVRAYLDAGAAAVGIASALTGDDPSGLVQRARRVVAQVRASEVSR